MTMTEGGEVSATPGPWGLQPCSHGGMVLVRGSRETGHPQTHLQIVPVEDARLIAAAPNLLEALSALVAEWESERLEWSENRIEVLTLVTRQPFTGSDLFDAARAAIAKASTEQGSD